MALRPQPDRRAAEASAAKQAGTLQAAFLTVLKEWDEAAADPIAARAAELADELKARLAAFRAEAVSNPFANPVLLLAVEIERRLAERAIGVREVERLQQRLIGDAFVAAAERLGERLGECDPERNLATVRRLIEAVAVDEEGRAVPFALFAQRVERALFGIVFTAHPTFRLTAQLMRTLVQIATDRDLAGKPLDPARRRALLRVALEAQHRPDALMTLDAEHVLAQEAIDNLHGALHAVTRVVLEVGRRHFAEDWTSLAPRLVTVASWVGYDLDGRADISWAQTYAKRLDAALRQMKRYRDLFMSLLHAHPGAGASPALAAHFDQIKSRLEHSIEALAEDVRAFGRPATGAAGATESIARTARSMAAGRSRRLVEVGQLTGLIEQAVAGVDAGADPTGGFALDLLTLRAEAANFGFGAAHTHVRLNATQLHNAIRRQIGLGADPDDPSHRRSHLAALNGLLETVEPVSISFGSVMSERSSAKRLFMLVAQMLKYIDATTPVRFLIAETESPFTLLTALYFAKLFGVADRIEITPLFETRKALERGARVIEEILENPHYWSYIASHGRLCVQTGYSDSGRYLGQSVAAAAIERLRLRLGEALTRHAPGQLELVIFDTHGESIGRGGHPGGLPERLNYVSSAASRRQFAEAGIAVKQETSFQGGDGYLFFFSPTAALASLTRILEFSLAEPAEADDPYYDREADYAAEFFTTIQSFNEQVMGDPGYGALLSVFGNNLTYPSGSRAVRRQYDGAAAEAAFARQMRAIPHNTILQQLGFLAIAVGGAGRAIGKNPEAFRSLLAASPRFRRLTAVIMWAARHSDFDLIGAYAATFDPATWLDRAGEGGDEARFTGLKRVAEYLEKAGTQARIGAVLRLFHADWIDLAREMADLERRPDGTALVAPIAPSVRDDLHLLHALRLALVARVYLLSTAIPDFSDRYAVTAEQVHGQVLRLEIPLVLDALNEIFPRADREAQGVDFGERATYASESTQTYEVEHEHVFQPLKRYYELIQQTSAGIHHILGAIG